MQVDISNLHNDNLFPIFHCKIFKILSLPCAVYVTFTKEQVFSDFNFFPYES